MVSPYDPVWPSQFQVIRDRVLPLVQDFILRIEHVGSTSVPGLAAKPIIDVDIIYRSADALPSIILKLESLGCVHEGNKGIPDREAFKAPPGLRHHLYVCREGCLALRNHLAVRDYLRTNAAARNAYGDLKLKLAAVYEKSPAEYGEAKTAFLTDILEKCGVSETELSAIADVNRARGTGEK